MLSRKIKFISAVALQVAIIAAMVIFKLSILAGGTEVVLQIAPVDPRDILRGDYVTFQYRDMSNLPSYLFSGQKVNSGDTVYVTLVKTGNYWRPLRVLKIKPGPEEVFIKGRVDSNNSNYLSVIYGIEQYFIPEGQGQNFNFSSDSLAKVVVDGNGNAVLKQLYINNKPWP